MIIKNYGIVDRESSALEVITRLLVNCRVLGANNSRIRKLPGTRRKIGNGLIIATGGALSSYGTMWWYKNPDVAWASTGAIITVDDNKLYYWTDSPAGWTLVAWNGAETQDFNEVKYWIDRGVLFIGGGVDGVPATLTFIDRQIADDNGYFDNAEEYEGLWFGEQELPEFSSDNINSIIAGAFRVQIDGKRLHGPGLSKDTAHFIMCQNVYEGGQVSIPISTSARTFGQQDVYESAYADIRISVDADDYDKRLTAIDVYVASLPETGFGNKIDYPGVWGETESSPVRTIGEEQHGSLDWRWLRRLNVKKQSIIFSGVMKVSGSSGIFTYDVPELSAQDDFNASYFPDGCLSGGDYYAYFRPIDESEDWQEALITNCTYTDDGSDSFMRILFDTSGVSTTANKYYMVRIISKWTLRNDIAASGLIQILDFDDLAGVIVTVNGTALEEGHEWHRGGLDNNQAASSLATAIDGISGVSATYKPFFGTSDDHIATIIITATTAGTAGNSIEMSTDAEPEDLVVATPKLVGGRSGNYYTLNTLWRFSTESGIEVGDPVETAQPYALVEEYFPKYRFAAHQNRRSFYLDVTLDKRFRNRILWSEVDKPNVVPNRNQVILNTNPGETSMGLVSINNALLALYEHTGHYIRLTGEPIQYDEEESRFEANCISKDSVFDDNGVAYFASLDGLMSFDRNLKNLTEQTFDTDYKAIIASEYAGNSSSYSAINGIYFQKEKLALWSFPNSTYTIHGFTVNMLAVDMEKGNVIVIVNTKTFTQLFKTLKGQVYGVNQTDGTYQLFPTTPVQTNQAVWRSGVLTAEGGNILLKEMRIRYDGQMTMKLTKNISTELTGVDFGLNSSMDYSKRDIIEDAEELEIQIESTTDTNDFEMTRIELNTGGAVR